MSVQRDFLDFIGSKIGAKSDDLNPWYNIDQVTVFKFGGSGLLAGLYDFSPYAMLKKVYPDHEWLPWKFKKLPRLVGKDPEIIQKALNYIEKEQKIQRPKDWYEISRVHLRALGVSALISQSGGLFQVLKTFRPDYNWEEPKFIGNRHFGKRALGFVLKQIWPQEEIVEDYDLIPSSPAPSLPLKISYFIPNLNLGFDFQTLRDSGIKKTSKVKLWEHPEKKAEASKQGITLFFVPFWWDRTLGSLLATILSGKPSLSETLKAQFSNFPDLESATPIPRETKIELSGWRKTQAQKY